MTEFTATHFRQPSPPPPRTAAPHRSATGPLPAAGLETVSLMGDMSPQQQLLFQAEYGRVAKNPTTGLLLCLFLGGLGVHQFYLGRILLGVVYLLFCWTFIPALIALIELFTIRGQVEHYNREQAAAIAGRVKLLGN